MALPHNYVLTINQIKICSLTVGGELPQASSRAVLESTSVRLGDNQQHRSELNQTLHSDWHGQ